MTKAFKKGFAAVLSIMMVLCFMPSMAFADAAHTYKSHEWAKDYSSVTVTYQDGKTTKFDAERTINEVTGLIEAVPQPKVIKSNTVGVPDTTEEVPSAVETMHYYDFSGAKVYYTVDNKDYDLNDKNVDYENIYSKLDTEDFKIKFAKPSGVKTMTQVAGKDVDLELVHKTNIANWTIVATPDKTFKDQPTADETVTISYKIKANGEATGKEEAPKVINNNLSAVTFTVTGKAKVDKDVDITDIEGFEKIYFDSIPEKQEDKDRAGVYSEDTLTTKYDGETHKVVAEEFKGWTATFEVFNDATGEWEAKKEISVKDVQDNPEEFRLSYSNKSGVKTEAVNFAANLEQIGRAHV